MRCATLSGSAPRRPRPPGDGSAPGRWPKTRPTRATRLDWRVYPWASSFFIKGYLMQVKTNKVVLNRGTTASPSQSYHPHSVRRDGGRTLAGLECLQADLCRSLGGVSTRPSALSDILLRWPGGQDARVWQPGQDGVPRIPLLALRPGDPSGGDELQIVVMLAVCQSLRGQLGQPGQHDA